MKRSVSVLAVFGLLASASPVFAAGGPESQAPRYDFSAKAAGIEAMVRAETLRERTLLTLPARAPQATTAKKSFWKTPWPYLIAGGAIAAGLLIAYSGDGNGY